MRREPYSQVYSDYKMSQDHLELFFGAVRAAGGWNNNLTALQFNSDVPNDIELSGFKSAAISYIAGYVVRMMQKKPTV